MQCSDAVACIPVGIQERWLNKKVCYLTSALYFWLDILNPHQGLNKDFISLHGSYDTSAVSLLKGFIFPDRLSEYGTLLSLCVPPLSDQSCLETFVLGQRDLFSIVPSSPRPLISFPSQSFLKRSFSKWKTFGKNKLPQEFHYHFMRQKCLFLREINLMRDTEAAADMPFSLPNEMWFLRRLQV